MTPRSEIDNVDVTGCTALSWAVQCRDRDSAEQLLLRGSDPGIVDFSGRNPLHYAVSSGDISITQLLLAANADVHAKEANGVTALHMAATLEEGTPIINLLLSRGASPDSEDNEGFRPLHRAAYNNNPGNMQLLLTRGANINAANKFGTTALMSSVFANAHKALRLLLHNQTLDCTSKNSNSRTVLDLVALHGDPKTLQILLTSSDKLNRIDLQTSQAPHLAARRREYDGEAHSVRGNSRRPLEKKDPDPPLWYSAFEALWNSIAETQRPDLECKPECDDRVIGRELTEDEGEDAEIWEDAREAVDGSVV